MDCLTNLGISMVFAKTRVEDTSKIFVSTGLGFFVEMELQHAFDFLGKKEAFLTEKFDAEVDRSSRIKTQIHEMLLLFDMLREST